MANTAQDAEANRFGEREGTIPEEIITSNKDMHRLNQTFSPSSTEGKKKCSVKFQCYEGGYWMAKSQHIQEALAEICSDDPVWEGFDVVVDPSIDPKRFVKIMRPSIFLPFALGGKFDITVSDNNGPHIRLQRERLSDEKSSLYNQLFKNRVYADTGISKVPSITISFATALLTGDESVGCWDSVLQALTELPNLRQTTLHLPENNLLSIEATLARSELSVLDVHGKYGVYYRTSASFWNQLATTGAHDKKRKRDMSTPTPSVLLGNVLVFDLSYIQLPHDGWLALCKWLQMSKSIQCVSLFGCRVENDGNDVSLWDPLVEVFHHNHKLCTMYLKFANAPQFSPDWVDRVRRVLCNNYTLKYLTLYPHPLPPRVQIRLDMNQCGLSSLASMVSPRSFGSALIRAPDWYPKLQHGGRPPKTPHPALDCLFVLFQENPNLIQYLPSVGWGN